MTSIYQNRTTVAEWYGQSITVPQLDSSKFIPFASSCLGIAISLLDKKTNRRIAVGLSDSIDTAYANPEKSLIVISNRFMRGNFSAIGAQNKLSAPRTVGSILGIIVHEIGHFAYSPVDLKGYVAFVESRTTKQFNFALARTLANTLEDIFIEYQIARLAPTLAWTLDEINRIMLTDQLWKESIITMKNRPVDVTAILNFLLFAKVVPTVKKVDPFASQLFLLARSVTKKESLSERFELCLKLYDLIARDKPTANQNQKSNRKPEPQSNGLESEPDNSEPDNEPESEEEDGLSESTEDDNSSNSGDSSNDPESDGSEDDAGDSGDSMGDPEEEEEEEDDDDPEEEESEEESDSTSGGSGELEEESEDDPEESENGGSGDNSTGDNDPENSDPEVGHSDSSESPEFDPTSVIPQIDSFENRESPIPDYRELSTELGYKPSLDDHIVVEKVVEVGSASLEMDRRYTRLSEMAKQRTNANIGYGEQKNHGRNMRQLYRIATDQKVFSTRIMQETVKPFECMIVLDCSGSMTQLGDSGTVKLLDASKAVLGAATGLEYGKAIVSVYGHTSDPNGTNKRLKLYTFKNSAESLLTLARRLYSFNYEHFKYDYSYNRDGYALYELSKRFVSSNRQKIMIVISDGIPNGRGFDYDGRFAESHTKRMVESIRKTGTKIYSISIDHSAFEANNRIYGTAFNTCAISASAIDDLIRQLYA